MRFIFYILIAVSLFSKPEKTELEPPPIGVVEAVELGVYDVNIHGVLMHATPEDFGYHPNMTPEETNAVLQNLFDTTVNVSLTTQTYTTSVELFIDTVVGQTINGNAATIQATSNVYRMLVIDKRTVNGGITAINNLTIDGNGFGQVGMQIYSITPTDNVTVMGTYQWNTAASGAGIWLELYNDDDVYGYGDWTFNNTNIDDITGLGDNDPGNVDGAVNGFLVFHREIISPSNPVNITFQNGDITNCFASDGENIGLFSPGLDVSNQGVTLIFDNVNLAGWERRSVKAFCGNLIFRNGTTTEVDANDPRITGLYEVAGMFVVAQNSGATGASNILIEDWEFIGNPGTEYDDNLIILDYTDITLSRLTFTNGTDFGLGGVLQDLTACALTFDTGGGLYEYTGFGTPTDNGGIVMDTDNVYVDSPFDVNITTYSITETDLSCPASGGQGSPNKSKSFIRRRI